MPIDRTIFDFEIIWKKINHTLTDEEDKFLSQWLNESPSHQRYFEKAVRYYQEGSDFSDSKAETEQAWKTLKNNGLKSRRNKSGWIISLSAAAAAIFLIVTFLLPPTKTKVQP